MVVTTIKPFVDMVDTNGEILKGLARKAVATNSSLANKSVNWLLQNAGDNPDTAELLAQMKIFKDEAARVVSNPNLTGVLSDTARQEMQAVIDGSMPINSMERVINRLQQDSHIRVNKLMDENQRLKDSFNPKKKGSSPSVSDSTAPVNASPTAPIIRKYNPATGKIE
jgi:CHASE1-domain containing sensor protein